MRGRSGSQDSAHFCRRTMLTLYLTRHAKSSKDDPTLRDFDRPLNERGVSDAALMADVFAARGETVDRLVTSPALRALTTAKAFAKALGVKPAELELERDIYEADVTTLLHVVRNIGGQPRSAMLFGHNPGFSLFTAHLTSRSAEEMPTCTTVRIDLDAKTWEDVKPGGGTLKWIDFPRNHK
jgi:phosphohistidine phosphatase